MDVGVPHYGGPAALLTAATMFIAGETFAQVLIDRPGGIVRMGANTQAPSPTPWTAHRTPHTAHRTPHTAHRTPHTAHRTPPRRSGFRTRSSSPAVERPSTARASPHIRRPVFTEEEFATDRDSAFGAASR
ncbi:hypothetical protein [Streptomyces sp. AC154]|uniref:hypothetical protein n=1 Tax=Streptomyces sp. AC154 TaxID=3143184 RepID=UPI003F7DBB5B